MASSTPTYKSRTAVLKVDSTRPQRRAIAAGKVKFCALSHGHYPGQRLPASLLPGVSNIGFLDARGEQDWGLEPHCNEGIEIVYLETGRMVFTLDQRRFKLTAGHITITRPWQLHCLGDPHLGPGRLHWLLLDVGIRRPHQAWHWPAWVTLSAEEKRELASKLRLNEHPVWRSTPALRHEFQQLAACVEQFDPKKTATRLTLHINLLLLNLLDALREQCLDQDARLTGYHRSVEMFLRELRERPAVCAEPWTLEGMAKHCGMGTTTFSRCSRELVNLSPWDYLLRCRLNLAAHRLKSEPESPITSIAFESGFNSSQYFAYQFHRRFGCSPRDYRADRSPSPARFENSK